MMVTTVFRAHYWCGIPRRGKKKRVFERNTYTDALDKFLMEKKSGSTKI